MTRVLLLATTTGYQIRSFGEAADTLGVRLVFASDRCDRLEDPWWDQAIPIRFHDEAHSVDAILASCADAPPAAVIAVGDRPAILAAHVAEALGLPGNPPDAARTSRNKLASRRAFSAAGLLTPSFEQVSIADDPAVLAASTTYPAVLKPLSLSASRGVIRVDNPQEFVAAFDRLRALMQSPDILSERDSVHEQLLIEAYLPGSEFAVEGVLTNGAFRAFAIFDKPDPLVGPFFEETIYVTPSRASRDVQDSIVSHIAAAAQALGLRHGPVHGECRVNERGVYVLEVAPRPIGGLCSKALRFCEVEGPSRDGPPKGGHYENEEGGHHEGKERGRAEEGASLEEVLLRHALGEDISGYALQPGSSGVMMIPIPKRGVYRGVRGVDAAREVVGIGDVRITAKADEVLVPLPEGHSYLGFIFATGSHAEAVEQALREAHSRLIFEIDRSLELAATPRGPRVD